MATDLTVVLDDRAGQLAHMGEALGDAGVNIEAIVPIGMQGGKVGVLLGVDNVEAANSALGDLVGAATG